MGGCGDPGEGGSGHEMMNCVLYSDCGLMVDQLDVQANCARYENGQVMWRVPVKDRGPVGGCGYPG